MFDTKLRFYIYIFECLVLIGEIEVEIPLILDLLDSLVIDLILTKIESITPNNICNKSLGSLCSLNQILKSYCQD